MQQAALDCDAFVHKFVDFAILPKLHTTSKVVDILSVVGLPCRLFRGGWIRDGLGKSLLTRLGALLVGASIRAVANRMSPSTYGASLLIGVNGLSYIGHGSADALAVENALKRADLARQTGLIGRLTQGLADGSVAD